MKRATQDLLNRLTEACDWAVEECHARGLTGIRLATIVVRDPDDDSMALVVTNDDLEDVFRVARGLEQDGQP